MPDGGDDVDRNQRFVAAGSVAVTLWSIVAVCIPFLLNPVFVVAGMMFVGGVALFLLAVYATWRWRMR